VTVERDEDDDPGRVDDGGRELGRAVERRPIPVNTGEDKVVERQILAEGDDVIVCAKGVAFPGA
jgi:hypothetical protein